ncbi:MAG TPA: hypothetical protein VMU26_14420 [Candidatus Polarisedimenticolia bacterium]|nr:hypothetical protein [Candidatus Polarisedimenticolia bacterium]
MSAVSLTKRMPDNIPPFAEAAFLVLGNCGGCMDEIEKGTKEGDESNRHRYRDNGQV